MSHFRTTIREAIVQAIRDADTDAKARVYDHPVDPRTSFPAITVEDVGEQQDAQTLPYYSSAPVQRQLMIDVGIEVQQVMGYAADRDKVCRQVEVAVMNLVMPGIRAIRQSGYTPSDVIGADRPIAAARQRFVVHYMTAANNPAVAI